MRDMARVVTLEKVIPMHQKDRIVCAQFSETAYEVIIPKEGANPGAFYAFIEADSILPVAPAWEFLRKRCFKENLNGFLIKPMKMGAKDFNGEAGEPVRSWGLAIPIGELPLSQDEIRKLKPGDDLTEALGIVKYEPVNDASPTKGGGKNAYPKWVKFCLHNPLLRWAGRIWMSGHQNSCGGFPTEIISKSDETTIQNMKWALEKFAESDVIITPKWEGQSATIVPVLSKNKKKVADVYPCSRNNAYKLKCKNDFWDTVNQYNAVNKIKEFFKKTGIALTLQAEQIGPGIQNNIYCLPQTEWRIYTIKNAVTGTQLKYDQAEAVALELGIPMVGVLAVGKMKDFFPDVETAVKWAENKFWTYKDGKFVANYIPKDGEVLWKDYFQWEGVVVRTVDYDKDNGVGCSFKIKNIGYQEFGLPKIAEACRKHLQNQKSIKLFKEYKNLK